MIIWASIGLAFLIGLALGYSFKVAHKTSNDKDRCTRVGYDLYECPCKRCIELDILREN